MASAETILDQLELCLAAAPQHAAKLTDRQIESMGRAWAEGLDDIPDPLLIAACRNHRDQSHWLPAPADIRASAVALMKLVSPANETALEAWNTVKKAILRHGTLGEWHPELGTYGEYGPVTFANPVTASIVRRLGWVNICEDASPESVIRAQFERYYDAEMTRLTSSAAQSAEIKTFVAELKAAQSVPQLTSRHDMQGIIRQIAEARQA